MEKPKKIPFDFTDADLLIDTKFRAKEIEFAGSKLICKVLSISPNRPFVHMHFGLVGIREVSYEQLQQYFEYYNKTMRQWQNCEKVG